VGTAQRVAVVTGAAQGIGKRTADLLAERGWALVLLDLRAAAPRAGARALTLEGDVASEAFAEDAAARTMAEYGRVDALVNNAGISCILPALETPADTYRRVLEVNLVGPFLLAKAFGRRMLEAGSGAVVNVASVAGLRGVASRSAYNASKHGVIGLTRTLAVEWGARGVRVNVVCPGSTLTEFHLQRAQAAGTPVEVLRTQRQTTSMLGRWAEPQEIAWPVLWLASDEASYITGTVLDVTGGR